jgi:hypothetical protein
MAKKYAALTTGIFFYKPASSSPRTPGVTWSPGVRFICAALVRGKSNGFCRKHVAPGRSYGECYQHPRNTFPDSV